MKILLASQNEHKLREMRGILGKLSIEVLSEADLGLHLDVEESGTTLEENSLLKARAVLAETGMTVIADDSGLSVDVLGGEPGVYSARYGGLSTDLERVRYLLDKLRDVPDGARGAEFVCVITCLSPDGTLVTARGSCRGFITREIRGTRGFGYDPVFFVPQFSKTFAELTQEEKDSISHRGRALRLFCEKMKENAFHADK